MGDSLHLVDFLVQNMAPSGLDKPTSLVQDNLGEGSGFRFSEEFSNRRLYEIFIECDLM